MCCKRIYIFSCYNTTVQSSTMLGALSNLNTSSNNYPSHIDAPVHSVELQFNVLPRGYRMKTSPIQSKYIVKSFVSIQVCSGVLQHLEARIVSINEEVRPGRPL